MRFHENTDTNVTREISQLNMYFIDILSILSVLAVSFDAVAYLTDDYGLH